MSEAKIESMGGAMITTLREQIQTKQMLLKKTVYQDMPEEVLDFPLTTGDFFQVKEGLEEGGANFYPLFQFEIEMKRTEQESGLEELECRLGQMERLAASLRMSLRGQERQEALKELRRIRRPLTERCRLLREKCYQSTCITCGFKPDHLQFLEYKSRVMATDFSNLTRMLPALSTISTASVQKIPWLTTDLSILKSAIDRGEPVGLVGGPCLFGIDEVLLQLTKESGERELFDLSCTRRCGRNGVTELSLDAYLLQNGSQIQEAHILNRKKGITRQEYLSFIYLFDFARALKGKVVIPLPDLSYIKYVENSLSALPEELRGHLMEEFKEQAFQITDLYLEEVHRLRGIYPELDIQVLHYRDQELCRQFYEKRAPYTSASSYINKITNADGKKEAVIDYITMLALPYYLFGTETVIQVDSLDETDSGRKCQKLHKGDFHLHSILYPEFLSGDGKNTIYHAPLDFKEYMNGLNMGKEEPR